MRHTLGLDALDFMEAGIVMIGTSLQDPVIGKLMDAVQRGQFPPSPTLTVVAMHAF